MRCATLPAKATSRACSALRWLSSVVRTVLIISVARGWSCSSFSCLSIACRMCDSSACMSPSYLVMVCCPLAVVAVIVRPSFPLRPLGRLLRRPQPLLLARLVIAYFARELGVLVACGATWLASGFGARMRSRRFQRVHQRLLRWFVHGLTERATSMLRISVAPEPSPDATAALERDGLWSVGDMGYVDAEGYLYVADRKSDMVISGGVNIYPQEAEDLLITHPKVLDAAVFGIPDTEMGERVHAVVQPVDFAAADGDLERELLGFCREHLAHYKCPQAIDFDAELPRQPPGKLYKRPLRDRYWGAQQNRIA